MLTTLAGSSALAAARSAGSSPTVRWNGPSTFVCIARSHPDGGNSSSGAPHVAPALLTRMSSRSIRDLTSSASAPAPSGALADEVKSRMERLDILVNNAGATWGAPLDEFPPSGWDRAMHTNVEGPFHLTVGLLPALRAAASAEDPARVVNIGSVDGLRVPLTQNYSYSAAKAAVHMLTRHLP